MAERFRYTFQIKWTSLLGVLSFGILVPTFFIPLELGSRAHYLSILVATLTSYIIWEGSKLIQAIVLYFFPWEKSIIKHLVYEITYIFVFSSLMLIIGILIYSHIVSSMDISV
ncbi:MAG TPA: hypothetical protein VL947_00560, partial [Cytophagales bacterium]|nr:hypothetical protein [Cytophagales bacterium]